MENIITVTLTHITFHVKTPDGQKNEIIKGLIQLECDGSYIDETFDLPWTDKPHRKIVFQVLQLYKDHDDTWPKDDDFTLKATECGYFIDGRPSQERFEIIGQDLYKQIFCTPELKNFLCNALKKNDTFNIIRLKIPQKGSFLQSCPWELLHDGTDFLFRPPHTTVLVRHVAFEQTLPSLPLTKTLHVALIDPRPHMPKEFDSIPQEERGLLDSLSSDTFKVTYPARNTLNDLRRILRENHPQIVHIDAHGDFGWKCSNPECNKINHDDQCHCGKKKGSDLHKQVYLAFLPESEDKDVEWVNEEELGRQLFDRNILLVVLSACHSGYISGKSTFNSVAGNLIRHGIPAVVAMQFSIDATTSKVFIEGLYETLINGGSLAKAVFEARRLLNEDSWYRPVLYLRTDSSNPAGQIFTTETSAREQLREWKEIHHQSQNLSNDFRPILTALKDCQQKKADINSPSDYWEEKSPRLRNFLAQNYHVTSMNFQSLKDINLDSIRGGLMELATIKKKDELQNKINELRRNIGDIHNAIWGLLTEADSNIKRLIEKEHFPHIPHKGDLFNECSIF